MTLGVNISPNDAAMAIRGLRTIDLRVRKSDASALEIYNFLVSHDKVEKVIYTMSSDFPQAELAQKQMRGNGGLLTLALKTDSKESVMRFTRAIKRFLIAVSWGGYESLMIPSITFHDMPGIEDSPIPWTFVRLYIGLEDPEYLIKDLDQALNSI